jgi:hypothetical protein
MGEDGHDQEFILMVEATGLDIEQVEALKKGFEGFDKVHISLSFYYFKSIHCMLIAHCTNSVLYTKKIIITHLCSYCNFGKTRQVKLP